MPAYGQQSNCQKEVICLAPLLGQELLQLPIHLQHLLVETLPGAGEGQAARWVISYLKRQLSRVRLMLGVMVVFWVCSSLAPSSLHMAREEVPEESRWQRWWYLARAGVRWSDPLRQGSKEVRPLKMPLSLKQ